MADNILGLSPVEAIIKAIQDKMGLLPEKEKEDLADKVKKEWEKEKEKMRNGEEFDPDESWKDLFPDEIDYGKSLLFISLGVLVFMALKD